MHPNPFIHTTTTGGGALACSAAIAAINVTLRDRLWEQAATKGDYIISKLESLAAQYPQIYESTLAPHASAGVSNVRSQTVMLTLYWQAVGEMDTDYTVFAHLVDGKGTVWGQHDSVPMNGTHPTTLWQPGEFVTDAHLLALPPDLPPGDYALEVGLYQVETGLRLAVAGSGDKVTLDKFSLAR